MKQLLVSYLVFMLVFSPLSAIDNIDTSEDENVLNRVPGKKTDENPKEINNVQILEQNVKKLKKTNTKPIDFDEHKKVTLMDVVLEAISNSDLLKSQKEKVKVAEHKLNGTIAAYYPELDFQYKYQKFRATDTGEADFKFYDERNYKFALTHNIYDGGGTKNNVLNYKKRLDIAKNKYNITLSQEVGKAIKAYFGVVFDYRAMIVNERNMDKLNTILEIVNNKYKSGALSIGDLTAIEASVSNAETKLVNVKSDLNKSLAYYEYIVGENFIKTLPYEKNFNIEIGSIDSLDLLIERANNQNKNLITYYESIEGEKYKLKKQASEFAPELDFELSFDNIVDKENFSEREETLKAALKLSYNIFDGGVDKSKMLEIYSTIRDIKYRLAEEKRKLKWNIGKLHNSINATKDSVSSKISEVVASRKMVEAYWEGFKLGEQDLQVLLQGHKQLNSAETDLIDYEKDNMTNLFTLLSYTGDLLSFFDIDPVHPKFIDFAKSSYNNDVYIDDKFLEEKERLDRETKIAQEKQRIEDLAAKATQDDNIKAFTNDFMNADENNYTIDIGIFDNVLDAENFIKSNLFDKLSFPYDIINGYELDTKVAYGNYINKSSAQEDLEVLKSKQLAKNYEIRKVSDIKRLYNDYLSGLEVIVEPTPPEIKVIEKIKTIEKIKQEKKKKEFALSESFKIEFLNAPANHLTINISSFKSMKDIENLVNENKNLYDKSFAFNYIDVTKLVRLMYGVFPNYKEAQSALESLGDINKTYYPVIELIGKEQGTYNKNKSLNIKKKEPKKEYEYVNITTKTEYKEPVTLKDSDNIKDKKLKDKVDNILGKDTSVENKEAKNIEKLTEAKEEANKVKKEEKESKKEQIKTPDTNIDVVIPVVIPVVTVPVITPIINNEEKEDSLLENSLVISDLKDIDKYNNQEFKEEFLNAPKDYYTINIATLDKVERVGKFTDYYGLSDKSFVFTVGEDLDKIKVMYGIYDSRDKVLEAVENLPNKLKASNKPYIERIYRKQDLYNLYHRQEIIEKVDNKSVEKEELNEKAEEKLPEVKEAISNTKDEVVESKKTKNIEESTEAKKEEKESKKEEVQITDTNVDDFIPVAAPIVAVRVIAPIINNEEKQEDSLLVSDLKDVDKYNNKEFKEEFLNAPKDYYTINIATLDKVERVGKFIDYYNLNDKSFVFTFGDDLNKIKVMYGVYDSRDKVLKVVNNLPNRLIESNKPYIERIYRKQDLYNLYHGQEVIEKVDNKSLQKEELNKMAEEKLPEVKEAISNTKDEVVQSKEAKNIEESSEAKEESIKAKKDDALELVNNEEFDDTTLSEVEIAQELKNNIGTISDSDLLEKADTIQKEEIKEIEEEINYYRVYVSTVSNEKIQWFINRYSIDTANLIQIEKGSKTELYLGEYETENEALKIKGSLHPRLTKTKVIYTGAK